jgi:purine-binding chemotaxis protein CheW
VTTWNLPSANDPQLMAVARRITQAIADAEATPLEQHRRLLVFRVAGTRLALPLQSIREVVEVPALLSKVPRGPAALLGIMNLRGRVVAVIDLAQTLPASLLDAPAPVAPATGTPGSSRLLLLERRRREMGLLVQEVEGIEELTTPESSPRVLDPEQVSAAVEALVS